MKFRFSHLVFSALALGMVLQLSGCQRIADRYIESYFDRKGTFLVEKSIDEIVKKKREEARREEDPPLDERMKNKVDVDVAGFPAKGPAGATVTIVEFSDFQCPFCKRVLPTVDEILKEYSGKIKLVFRQNPLPFHPNAMPAAKAAAAAAKQGKFWEMYDKLFGNQDQLTPVNYAKWAKELHLDMKKFEKDSADLATQKAIEADIEFARAHGANGTPSFFIGLANPKTVKGVLLVGAVPKEKFKEVIDAVIAKK